MSVHRRVGSPCDDHRSRVDRILKSLCSIRDGCKNVTAMSSKGWPGIAPGCLGLGPGPLLTGSSNAHELDQRRMRG